MRGAQVGHATLRLVQGDITRVAAEAIVNAANSSLLGGGGVDGAIHRAAGPELLAECRKVGGCPPGEARITGGGRLPARYVIHAVGPIWNGGGMSEREVLAGAYRAALALAKAHAVRSLAFPSISTGAYGFPEAPAARIALGTVLAELAEPSTLAEVTFVLFGGETLANYEAALAELVAGR